jgi:hypothetical protein
MPLEKIFIDLAISFGFPLSVQKIFGFPESCKQTL